MEAYSSHWQDRPDVRHPFATQAVVQGEWDQTLRRLRAHCNTIEGSEQVHPHRVARLVLRLKEGSTIEEVERILFENLLFAPWNRTAHTHEWYFGGEWLWRWRKAVPWRAEQVRGISLLPPGSTRNQWTYRFNVIDVEE